MKKRSAHAGLTAFCFLLVGAVLAGLHSTAPLIALLYCVLRIASMSNNSPNDDANKQQLNNSASRSRWTQASATSIRNVYGADAYALLMSIRGKGAQQRRLTLLRLADYKLAGLPLVRVFDLSDTINESNHYRHLRTSAEYKAAHQHLTELSRGILSGRESAQVEDMARLIAHSASRLGLLAAKAVDVLEAGLSAEKAIVTTSHLGPNESTQEIQREPDYTERRQAANSILDRNDKTSKAKRLDHTSNGETLPAFRFADVIEAMQKIEKKGFLNG